MFPLFNPLQNTSIVRFVTSWVYTPAPLADQGRKVSSEKVFQTLFFLLSIFVWLKRNFVQQIYAGVKSKVGWISCPFKNNFSLFQTSKRLTNGQGWKGSWNFSRKVFEKYWNSFQRSPHTAWFSHSQSAQRSTLQNKGVSYRVKLEKKISSPLIHQKQIAFLKTWWLHTFYSAFIPSISYFAAEIYILSLKDITKPRTELRQDNYEHKFSSQEKKKKSVFGGERTWHES